MLDGEAVENPTYAVNTARLTRVSGYYRDTEMQDDLATITVAIKPYDKYLLSPPPWGPYPGFGRLLS